MVLAKKRKARGIIAILALALVVFSFVTVLPTHAAAPSGQWFDHILVIAMENQDYSSVLGTGTGTSAAPFLQTLVQAGATIPNYHSYCSNDSDPACPSAGINNCSAGCYIAQTTGYPSSTQGLGDTWCGEQNFPGSPCITIPNLADKMTASSLTIAGFCEDGCPRGADHFPWPGYTNDWNSCVNTFTTCSSSSTPSGMTLSNSVSSNTGVFNSVTNGCGNAALISALNAGSPANLIWFTPSDNHNMHDNSISTGDNYLKSCLIGTGSLGAPGAGTILSTSAFTSGRTLLWVWWDEFDPSPNVEYGTMINVGLITSNNNYDELSTLHTILTNWGLSPIALEASAPAMSNLFKATGPAPLSNGFSFSPVNPIVNQVVSFTGQASGGVAPYTFSWNFGDSGTSTSQNPTHSYTSAATFTVTLTVHDSATPQGTAVATHTIAVSTPITGQPVVIGWGGNRLDEVNSFCFGHTPCSNPTSQVFAGQMASDYENAIQTLQSKGMNGVRTDFDPMCTDNTDFNFMSAYSQTNMNKAIQIASFYNFWIIIDMHGYNDVFVQQTCWLSNWKTIIQNTGSQYSKIVWEPENEPDHLDCVNSPINCVAANLPVTDSAAMTTLTTSYQQWLNQLRSLGDTHWMVIQSLCSYGCGITPNGDCNGPTTLINSFAVVNDTQSKVFYSIHTYMGYNQYSSSWTNATAVSVATGCYQSVLNTISGLGRPFLNTEGGADPLCRPIGTATCAPDGGGLDGSAGYSKVTLTFIQTLTTDYDTNNGGRISFLWWTSGVWTDTDSGKLGALDCTSTPKGWGCILNSIPLTLTPDFTISASPNIISPYLAVDTHLQGQGTINCIVNGITLSGHTTDLILAFAQVNDTTTTVSSVTSTGLGNPTWIARTSKTSSANNQMFEYYAILSSASGGSVNFLFSASNILSQCTVIVIFNENNVTPFDSNGAIPFTNSGTSATTSLTYSTTNPTDILIYVISTCGSSSSSTPTGFTAGFSFNRIPSNCGANGMRLDNFWDIVGSTQSSNVVTSTLSASSNWAGIADAVVTGTSTITVGALNGFTGVVTLAAATSPVSGISCFALSPPSITGSGTSTLACTSTTAGQYTVTVTGTSGSLTHSTTVIYQITDFDITGNPASVTITAGNAGTSTIQVSAINGYTGTVNLSIPANCGGASGSISPSSITITSSTLSATSTLSCTFASTGTFTVTVTGTQGLISHNVVITYVVTGSGDFSISAVPITISQLIGATGSSTITVTSINGFSGTVSLSTSLISGPTPTSCTVNPTSITLGSSGTSTLSCTFNTVGTAVIDVLGSSGILGHDSQVTFIIEDFSVSVSPNIVTVNVGTVATTTATITSINSFSGTVSLTFFQIFPFCSISPTSVTLGSSTTATITCTTTFSGQQSDILFGTSGSLVHQDFFAIIAVDFSMGISPTSESISSGNTGSAIITVNPLAGFTGTITLTNSINPASGLTCTFTTTSIVTSGTSTMSCSATSGVYTITVTGTSGSLVHSVTNIFTVLTATFSIVSDAGPGKVTTVTNIVNGATSNASIQIIPNPFPEAFDTSTIFNGAGKTSGQTYTLSVTPVSTNEFIIVYTSLNLAGMSAVTTSIVDTQTATYTVFKNAQLSTNEWVSIETATLPTTVADTITVTVTWTGGGTAQVGGAVELFQNVAAAQGFYSGWSANTPNPGTPITLLPQFSGDYEVGGLTTGNGNGTPCNSKFTSPPITIRANNACTGSMLFQMGDQLSLGTTPLVWTATSVSNEQIWLTDLIPTSSLVGEVRLSVTSNSPNLVCHLSSIDIPSGSGISTLGCKGSIAGNYQANVTATAITPNIIKSTIVNYKVQDISFTFTAGTIKVGIGITGSTTISFAPVNGYSRLVTFSVSAPSRVTCNTPASTPVPGSSTLSCSSNFVGVYSVVLTINDPIQVSFTFIVGNPGSSFFVYNSGAITRTPTGQWTITQTKNFNQLTYSPITVPYITIAGESSVGYKIVFSETRYGNGTFQTTITGWNAPPIVQGPATLSISGNNATITFLSSGTVTLFWGPLTQVSNTLVAFLPLLGVAMFIPFFAYIVWSWKSSGGQSYFILPEGTIILPNGSEIPSYFMYIMISAVLIIAITLILAGTVGVGI